MNNPIQIVLNDSDYIVPADPRRGGPPTDFYADRDEEFRRHKAVIRDQVDGVRHQIQQSKFGPALYVRVRLQEDAMAKSHRPNRGLFIPTHFPCVGAGALGELFYFVSEKHIASLLAAIDRAELTTTWLIDKSGKRYTSPSHERSEVGAIEKISVASIADKRDFDIQTAVSWLSDERSGGGYLIELYERPVPKSSEDSLGRRELASSLRSILAGLGGGTDIKLLEKIGQSQILDLRLTQPGTAPLLSSAITEKPVDQLDRTVSRHQKALDALAEHPLVRRISLPLKLILSEGTSIPLGNAIPITTRLPNIEYPKVGVIDSGLSPVLGDWIQDRHDYLAEDDVDQVHGTFIGGLLVDAQAMNGPEVGREPNGCDLYDLALYPKDNFFNTYPRGFADFLEELEQAVSEAVTHGVRVFNLSINAVSAVEQDRYSYYAARLDQIAEKHGVIFVNSAGNLDYTEKRAAWPKKPVTALKYFASRTEPDTIYKPSESVKTIAVGAINTDGEKAHIPGAPTTYTRRGPGLRMGCKPDVAHYGGHEGGGSPVNHGLTSIGTDGLSVSGCGTSYAAPLVAKTLASLDARIEKPLPAHALRAMLIHHTDVPSAVSSKRISALVRQFMGFGVPTKVDEMLVTDDSAITMVFTSRLPDDVKRPKVLRFPFAWPQSLVDPITGACHGQVRMTLVYDPPIDPAFGCELVRVNLDAKLQQRQPIDRRDGKPSYGNEVDQCFLPKTAGQPAYEKELIKQGLKWWPTKRYDRVFPEDGVGSSSEWRLEVSSLTRSEAQFPKTGVPFSLIVTIRVKTQ